MKYNIRFAVIRALCITYYHKHTLLTKQELAFCEVNRILRFPVVYIKAAPHSIGNKTGNV